MPFEFKFPDVGEGIQEGEIVKWLVKEGEVVKQDQNIVQVETDKAVVDLPSPKEGKIVSIKHKEGESVKVGEVLVEIGGDGDSKDVAKDESEETVNNQPEKKDVVNENDKKNGMEEADKRKGKSVVGELEEAPEDEADDEKSKKEESEKNGAEKKHVLASPVVRALAEKNKINLSEVKGSGENERILRTDIGKIISKGKKDSVENASESEEKENSGSEKPKGISVKKKYDEFGYIDRIPLKGIRKTIAQNMMASLQNSAQLTTMDEIDVTELLKIREKEKKIFEKKKIKLTLLPFIVKAVTASLKENPELNSTLKDDEIIIKKYFNIGIAVDTENGLMVPNIKIAENKTISSIAEEIQELAGKARTRKIDMMELKGGTFTITNYGSVGGTYSTPILNTGESGILGVGRIFEKVRLTGKDKLESRKILPVSLSFDHRILDGGKASRFLRSLRNFLEDPDSLLVELR